MIKLLL